MWLVAVVAILALLPQCIAENILRKRKSLTQWKLLDVIQHEKRNVDQKQLLVPGIPELGGGGGVNRMALELGFSPHPIDKYHSGDPKKDTCQPWEDCYSQRIGNLSTGSEVITTPEPTMNISDNGTLTFFKPNSTTDDGKNVSLCREWDLTKQGCQCFDTCECNRNPRFGDADTPKCRTLHIATVSSTNVTIMEPCGDLDSTTGDYYDTCKYAMAPTPEPEFAFLPRRKLKGNDTLYRDWNGPKNKRMLPKSSCFHRDYYCAKFPKFSGCVPGLTYKYSESMDNEIKQCEALGEEGQKKCEGKKTCGKGKHKSCHPMCVWSEDAPGWFREMRGKQNAWLKKHKVDPAVEGGPNRFLPVLQPAWTGSQQREGWEGGDEIVKKPTTKAGETTTLGPDAQFRAGQLGHGRSGGFVRAPDVGKNVGNDMAFSSEDDGPQHLKENKYDAKREGQLLL